MKKSAFVIQDYKISDADQKITTKEVRNYYTCIHFRLLSIYQQCSVLADPAMKIHKIGWSSIIINISHKETFRMNSFYRSLLYLFYLYILYKNISDDDDDPFEIC